MGIKIDNSTRVPDNHKNSSLQSTETGIAPSKCDSAELTGLVKRSRLVGTNLPEARFGPMSELPILRTTRKLRVANKMGQKSASGRLRTINGRWSGDIGVVDAVATA